MESLKLRRFFCGLVYKIWTGFEPGKPGRKADTITTELKRILSNAFVRYCI